MDLDGMHRDVRGLKEFKSRAERAISFIEGLQAAGFNPAPTGAIALTDDQKNQVRDQFSEIVKPLSSAIDIKMNSFDDRLRTLEQQGGVGGAGGVAELTARLSALEVSKAEAEEFSDRLTSMLTWFETNQEGLELLLSLDGDPDQVAGTVIQDGTGGTPPTTLTGGAPGSSEEASGSVSGVTGTEGPAEAGPLAGDPATAADEAVKEPVAGSDQV